MNAYAYADSQPTNHGFDSRVGPMNNYLTHRR